MARQLAGKRALVTAGAAGIGLATARALAAAGAVVSVADIDAGALAALPTEISGHVCDLADAGAIDRLMDAVLADGLDILVNNAGIAGPTAAIEDVSLEGWRQTFAVGLESHFLATRRVVPELKARGGGVIVNLASTAGLMGLPLRTPYVAMKFAIVGMTRSLAMELGAHDIRVNAIAPGSVEGPRMDRVIHAHAAAERVPPERIRALYESGVSMGCFVSAEEVAGLAVFLCSDAARHISGQIIAVDGHTETLLPRGL